MKSMTNYKTLQVDYVSGVCRVGLNRPKTLNAMNLVFFREMTSLFNKLRNDLETRCVVLYSTNARAFSSGLDIRDKEVQKNFRMAGSDCARKAVRLRNYVKDLQTAFDVIATCPLPVICALNGAAVGGAIDLASSCDIRLCSKRTKFSIKEVDVALVADIGTTARFPKIVGNFSKYAELLLTGRFFGAEEALGMGFVSTICVDYEDVKSQSFAMAENIAKKSPVAIRGCKEMLRSAMDSLTVAQLQDKVLTWNMSMLQTNDVGDTMKASLLKKDPTFAKL